MFTFGSSEFFSQYRGTKDGSVIGRRTVTVLMFVI
jgi:hypothetical protein